MSVYLNTRDDGDYDFIILDLHMTGKKYEASQLVRIGGERYEILTVDDSGLKGIMRKV